MDAGLEWATGKAVIRSIRMQGDLYRGRLVYIWVVRGARGGRPGPRVAAVTGRGFAGAVSRNLARRRIKGSVRDARGLLDGDSEYLVEARPAVEDANYQDLVIEVERLLCSIRERKPSGRE